MSRIDRPIFLIGTGRCGSSLLLRMLGYHPDVAWMSHYSANLPGGGAWAALSRVHDLPGLGRLLPEATRSRLIPQPTESYRPLQRATDHVFTSPRPLTALDVDSSAWSGLRRMASLHLRAAGKRRFLMKHTGFPRVAYLQTIFPDARFVHVKRDGRAVATSLCQVDWWSGEGHWGWGQLSPDDLATYRDSGCHELVLAGLYWKVLMQHLEEARAQADHLLEIRYDELVADPEGTLRGVAGFADLPWTPRFARRVAATPMTSDDTRWRKALTTEETALLEGVLATSLTDHGFVP